MTAASNHRGSAALIVEDDPVQVKIVRAMMRQLGVESLVATNVNEARRLLRDAGIQWILLDLKLGEESGLDLLRNLDAVQKQHSVVLVSGCDKKTQAAATRLAQAQGVHVAGSLSKPINRDELRRLLSETAPAHPLQPLQQESPSSERSSRKPGFRSIASFWKSRRAMTSGTPSKSATC